MNRDTAVGIVGAAVLIAAMAGVFFYERSQFEAYEVAWEPAEVQSTSESGTLDEGASESHTLTAEAERLSTVTARLSWSDEVGQADTFEVSVEGPEASFSETGEASSSPLEVEIPIREMPEISTVTGRGLDDARDELNASASWTDGTGGWTVTITLTDAPGEQLGGQETTADGSQDYELAFTVERWTPMLETPS